MSRVVHLERERFSRSMLEMKKADRFADRPLFNVKQVIFAGFLTFGAGFSLACSFLV